MGEALEVRKAGARGPGAREPEGTEQVLCRWRGAGQPGGGVGVLAVVKHIRTQAWVLLWRLLPSPPVPGPQLPVVSEGPRSSPALEFSELREV